MPEVNDHTTSTLAIRTLRLGDISPYILKAFTIAMFSWPQITSSQLYRLFVQIVTVHMHQVIAQWKSIAQNPQISTYNAALFSTPKKRAQFTEP